MPETASSYPFLTPPTSNDYLGSLAHYRVVSELGRGGMGYVFKAEDSKLKRSVALKVMNQKIAEVAGSRKRFISEARAMAAIHHDNVATIFEVGESGGTPFMAMEMLKGETLEERNRRKELLDFETVIQYATDIARGLEAAHVRGIVHRDIKPANIWIEAETNRIKILDFGLALASTPVDQLAGRGSVVGTPGYLSPEQARSDPLDNRSDLYSLGVVLYEMCTGKLPIQSKSVHQQLISILAHRPKPIDEVNPDVPKPLRDMIHKLLRKEPRSRFQSAKLLEAELKVVEEACHQQSEVAQAINRLKAGLDQVTTTDAAPVAASASPQVVENGFAGIDELPAPAMDPLAIPAGPLGQPGSISGAYQAVNPHAVGGNRPTRKKPPPQPSGLQKHLPLIAIACMGLIALPLMTFFFTGLGRSNENSIVMVPSGGNTPPPAKQPPAKQPPRSSISKPADQNKKKPQPKPVAAKPTPKPTPKQKPRPAPEPAKPEPKPAATPNPAGKEENKNSKNPNQAMTASDSVVVEKPSLEPENSAEPSKEASKEPAVTAYSGPTRVVAFGTIDKRGADAMVQEGSNDNMGLRPSLGVRTKGGTEVNHTYLRFDISQLKGSGDQIQDARLVLNLFGGKQPVGATVRVIGIKDAGLWPEDRIAWINSPSNEKLPKPLSKFPVLVKTTLTKAALDKHPGQVHLGGPKMVDFLRQEKDTVTFAIAGKWDERLLRFKSRERSLEESPLLQIVVPE
ncbi:Serine/threonine-protein kinase PknB [Rubripirellula obstinata]|uniref:Serine/threonine-protein kinase PknB n=1 Tax=Rubripirellula obstinata TaxID=406547 RepID=A0A5B1CCK9_9BACT|nr:protein kinase [Rubripirellula obstinata]KAA1258867.1 Serine/threonine-protein kinase PknB [Rubripirellula obstinata]